MWPSESTHPRIGYVLKMYPRFSETFILNEVLALEGHGADLEIFSLRSPADGRFHEDLAKVGAPVTYLPLLGKTADLWEALRRGEAALPAGVAGELSELLAVAPGDAFQAVRLACEVLERRIDHLHAHFGSVATTVARLAARLAGITYSFTAHAKDIFHADVDDRDLRRKLEDAAFVVTVSDYNVEYLRETFGRAADGVIRIYNGLDLEIFSAGPATPHQPPVIAAVGRLVEKKGFQHLIEAAAHLTRSGRELRVDLVGGGAEERKLRALVDDLELGQVVHFHGPLPQGRTRKVVRDAAALVAPCVIAEDGNRDGLPTVILEALAVGTPVVATAVTGTPEAVLHEETGLLLGTADPVELAEAISRLLDDPGLAGTLAFNGRRHVEATFDVRQNTKELYGLLCEAASRPRAVR